jgi:hypothetical protein
MKAYAVILLLIVVGILNEYINRAKWTRAQSIFQAVGVFLLAAPFVGSLLDKTPGVRWLLQRMANFPREGLMLPPPTPPAAAWLPLVFLAFLSACGGLTPYYTTLAGVERIVTASADHFSEFDRAKRAQIVQDAKSEATGLAALEAWNKTAEKLTNAIVGTDASVRLARDALADIAKGVRAHAELTTWIGPILDTAKNLQALLASVGFVLPKEVH